MDDMIAAAKAKAAAKAAEIKARMAASASAATPSPKPSSAPSASTEDRLAAIKARMAALKGAGGVSAPTDTPPVRPPPAALNNDDSRPNGPRFATTLGNRRTESPLPGAKSQKPVQKQEEEKENPYFDPKAVTTSRDRVARGLLFNRSGKYLEQAGRLRQQGRLEQIKDMLAKTNRQAKLDENSERGFLVPEPPDVEWWDEGLLADKTYDLDKLNIEMDDSIITLYIQHPVMLKAPQDQLLIPVKPMYLTSKEQAKLRRMRRAEEHKEQQAKIRLGLEPPPPPKVKRGNMMRVMGEKAIADPT